MTSCDTNKEEEEEGAGEITLQKNILNTKRKKITIFSFILFYPLISLTVGAPIPIPETVTLITMSPELVALFNFISLLITLVGSIVGIGFYLEKRNNNKLEIQARRYNEKITRLEERIDEAVTATHQNINYIREDMKNMENRICDSVSSRVDSLDNAIQIRVSTAKQLVDSELTHINNKTRDMDKRLTKLEWNTYNLRLRDEYNELNGSSDNSSSDDNNRGVK